MFAETSRALSFLPQFSKVLRLKSGGMNKFCSTVLAVQSKDGPEGSQVTESQKIAFESFRLKYTEFLPNPDVKLRNLVREKLERTDMLRRRIVLNIPEFYVGSVLAVTSSNKHAVGKQTRFVGICISKSLLGLNSQFVLRNVIEHQGVEIIYYMYSPLIQKIEVLRLEKRLDDELYYLRDAPEEFSTFPMDMVQEYSDKSKPVPVNTIKVPLKPRPWTQRWELKDLKGAVYPELSEKILKKAAKAARPWEKYDLMDEYRKITPEEEQKDIFEDMYEDLKIIESRQKIEKRKKVFVKPTRQKLF